MDRINRLEINLFFLIIPKGKVHHETLQRNPKNQYYTINIRQSPKMHANTEAAFYLLTRSDDVSFVFVDIRSS